jgi:hypothetical protein
MTEFRGRLRAGDVELGEVSGSYRSEPDGGLGGSLYVPDEIPIGDHMGREDLVLAMADGVSMRIDLQRIEVRAGRGWMVEFVRNGTPFRGPAAG